MNGDVGLTPAERARTILAGAPAVRVGVPGIARDVREYAVTPDGALLFVPPADSPERVCAVAGTLPVTPVVATAVDVAGIPQPDRVRGTVLLTGPLSLVDGVSAATLGGPDGTRREQPPGDRPVLALVPTRVSVEWLCDPGGGPVTVPVADYREASPDPVAPIADTWLRHLAADHPDVVRALAEEARGGAGAAPDAVRPIGADRFGLVLRAGDGHLRVPFARPVRCACEVRSAFDTLVRRLAYGGS